MSRFWFWGDDRDIPATTTFECAYCKCHVATTSSYWRWHANGDCIGRKHVGEKRGEKQKADTRTSDRGTSIQRISEYPPRAFIMGTPPKADGVERAFADEKKDA